MSEVDLTVLLSQFADGVYLVLLMGLLEGYFVPLYNFFLTPENFDQKVKSDYFSISTVTGILHQKKPYILSIKQSLAVGLIVSEQFVVISVMEDSSCSLEHNPLLSCPFTSLPTPQIISQYG